MTRSFLLLHGIENHRPPGHWQFETAEHLRSQGHEVLYPQLPEPDAPSFDAWAGDVHRLLAELPPTGRTVICHSLACLLWFGMADAVAQEKRPERLLLVSPPDPAHVPETGASFRRGFDAELVRRSAGEIRVVVSDADPYNPSGAGEMYGKPLGCPVDVIVGGGHVTPAAGYGHWPSLEAWCDGTATALLGHATGRVD